MIRASKNSPLQQRRSKLLPSVAYQRKTRRLVQPASTISPSAIQCQTYRIRTTAVVVVVVAMVVPAMVALVELYFVSYTRCDFFYTLMSSVLLGGLTSIAIVALTRKHCNS